MRAKIVAAAVTGLCIAAVCVINVIMAKSFSDQVMDTCTSIEKELWSSVAHRTVLVIAEGEVDTSTINVSSAGYRVAVCRPNDRVAIRVLERYGISVEYPLVVVVDSPILYVSSGAVPILAAEGIKYIEKYHPAAFFNFKKGVKVGIVAESSSDVVKLIDKLKKDKVEFAVYCGWQPYTSLIELTIGKKGDYVFFVKDGVLRKVVDIRDLAAEGAVL